MNKDFNEMLSMQKRMTCKTEAQKISCLIREKYSQDAEFAILRQRETKPEEYAEYNAYCEECKTKVKNGTFDAEMNEYKAKRRSRVREILKNRK